MENEARWAISVFCGKNRFPDKNEKKIKDWLDYQRRIREFKFRPDTFSDLNDIIAKEAGFFPDLDLYEKEDPELFNYLVNGPLLVHHFPLNGENSNYTLSRDYIKKVNSICPL